MGRIVGIDFGLKRTGIAVTDPMKIIASPLTTVATKDIFPFLKDYCGKESVEGFVVGMPKNLQNQDTHATSSVRKFIANLQKQFPGIGVTEVDERFTSKIALDAMIAGGMKKKDRRDKANIDKISATVILQSYLDGNQLF
ncbi:Putative Holliday junction resolvase [Fulvivirga imtechensis AK7]|uniref:Putative pre-16S rRNA nuclease n=1 Tax=Fulvivirga imtechensis AK7 TaxID=1237149 RepID=L8JT83_9BACT|nr:Holliday junction resolvase RuvX [Fulvivirga imtechensis]ELR72186.1 Putative Holliday junction resolvase [Fulvivirga imtechensis AK7]